MKIDDINYYWNSWYFYERRYEAGPYICESIMLPINQSTRNEVWIPSYIHQVRENVEYFSWSC